MEYLLHVLYFCRDLNFKKGDIILLKRKIDVNWYVGEINGREGAIPMNYVQVVFINISNYSNFT